jgi:hypothetical protein
MTLIPRSTSVNPAAVGSQSVLSQYDIQSLTRAYSCAGRVSTNGGGYSQVIINIHLTFIHSAEVKFYKFGNPLPQLLLLPCRLNPLSCGTMATFFLMAVRLIQHTKEGDIGR